MVSVQTGRALTSSVQQVKSNVRSKQEQQPQLLCGALITDYSVDQKSKPSKPTSFSVNNL